MVSKKAGTKWSEHVTPFLKKAMLAAKKTYVKKEGSKATIKAVKSLRDQKAKINAKIKTLKGK